MDDLVLWDAVLFHDLESVAGVRLMSIVVELVGSGNDNSPVVRHVSVGLGNVNILELVEKFIQFVTILGLNGSDGAEGGVFLEQRRRFVGIFNTK